MEVRLFNLHGFQVDSKLIYVILASGTLGALLMFFLFSTLPEGSRRSETSVSSKGPHCPFHQIEAAMQLGEHEKAKSLLAGISGSDAQSWQARRIAGDMAAQRGDWSGAEKLYREAFKADPQQPVVLFALARFYDSQGLTARAQDFYQEVLQLAPHSLEALLRLRMLAVSDQKWEDALHWQEYVEHHLPKRLSDSEEEMNGVGIRFELAHAEFRNGAYRTAQALLKYVLRMQNGFVPAHLLSGEILDKMQNPSAALRVWERGFEQTRAPVLLQRIGEHLLRQGKPEKAIEFLRSVAAANPHDLFLEFCLADLFLRMEMVPEAIHVFGHILQAAPDWHLPATRLASLYRRTGQPERAADLLQKVVGAGDLISGFTWQCYTCHTMYPEYRSLCLECLSWNGINIHQNQAVRMESMNEKSTAYPV